MDIKACYYPITHSQKRIWYTEKFYQGTGIGNISATIKIIENVDCQLLEKAINIMIEKNDGLRLRITERDGQVMQYISEYKYAKLDFFDFRRGSIEDLYEWEKKQACTPFILEDSDLYYFAIVKVTDNEAYMFMKLHHLINDGWTMVMLTNKILKCYNDLKMRNDTNYSFPSYTEYIESERQYKNSKRFIMDKGYWNSKFETIPEPANLKKKDMRFKDAEAGRESFEIPCEITSNIRAYCQEHKTSIFTFFLSALAIYIYRVTGNDDIVLGVPVLNRSNYKEKDTLGMFVSTVPVRVKVDDSINYKAFVNSIISDWMGMLKHQHYPYDLLLKDLRKKDNRIENLYDIILSYQNGRFKDVGADFEGRWISNGYQADPLFISINDRDGDLSLLIDYDYMTQFFNAEEIIHMHERILNIVQDAMSNPEKLISKLELISEGEKQCLIDKFNNTAVNFEIGRTMQQLFEQQSARTPDNIAVVFENKYLTYRQLNEKSNQVARLLRESGIKPESIVAVLTNRSLEMIIGIMAVLKAGGCYMPLDPEYPSDRIEYMLHDSRAEALLTRKSLTLKINYSGIVIDLDSSEAYNAEASNIDNINTPGDPAYVMYTSGSTGRPKAVIIEHKALANYIGAVEQLLDYNAGGTVLSVTTMAFDIFVFEIFPSLAKGLKIVLANEQQQKIPELLSELIIKEKVEKILTTPSRMQLLIFGQSNKRCFDVLKEIVLGGEAFPQKLLDDLKKITNARIFNMYGPTEATVYATFKELTGVKYVNAGSPIANYKIYIVDKFYNLVPVGVSGELCISGDGVARGYLNNRGLTNEKFVPNPLEQESVMYKTGDLAVWSPEGEIEIIGRMDHQVKIRGYRIELGEIETHLMMHELVEEAVVVDREDATGKKYLSAYYVSEVNISPSEFRNYLSRKLPDYMIPASYTKLDKVPLSQNGKIDRKALPEPERALNYANVYAEPRNDIDRKLVSIWSRILDINIIGIDDNFFEIGGDSLTIIEAQIEMLKYHWKLNTQEFYKFNTIRKLSDRISEIMIDYSLSEAGQEAAAARYTEEIADMSSVIDNSGLVEKYRKGFKYRGVLLTGTTGFFGIHVLKELLTSTDAEVYCMIRGRNDREAEKRLRRLLKFYFRDNISGFEYSRLHIIKGDVSLSSLGLDEKTYKELGNKVDLVIHTAAIVKYFGDYKDYQQTNVTGTKELADFCLEFDMPLAHISTLGVSGHHLVGQEQKISVFTENDFYIGQRYMDNVYVRSKFEAENLLYKKMAHGLKAGIFRLGNLTGRFADGHFQSNMEENGFYNTLQSLVGLGAVNKEVLEQKIEFTPVDYCSKAIVTLLNVEDFSQRVYHIFNHNLISLEKMLELFRGADINVVSMDRAEFSEYIDRVVLDDDQKKKTLLGIVNNLGENKSLDFSTLVNIDSTITVDRLKQLGFEWPGIDAEYIKKILRYMRQRGYIK